MQEKIFYTQDINLTGKIKLKFRVVEINSHIKQGFGFKFSIEPRFKGAVYIGDYRLKKPKRKHLVQVVSVEDMIDDEFILSAKIEEGFLSFSNASDILGSYPGWQEKLSAYTGKSPDEFRKDAFWSGFSRSYGYAYGFWKEQISPRCYRFHCNDHEKDEDFDDLIFDVEIIECDDPGFSL